MGYDLGSLKKVKDLRSIWANEATDFTKWLAEEENIKILSEEIGINIVVDQTEAQNGRYFSDILAHEEESERTIIIENQLESTNHDHLGKVIVYSSGLDAEIQIWLVKEAKDEHKQAVDWLNEHSDEHINIFLVEIELWQIDDSKVAPKFQIVSQPNNWTKVMRRENKQFTKASELHFNFWAGLKTYCDSNHSEINIHKPSGNHWSNVTIGKAGIYLSLTYNTNRKEVACALHVADNKEFFNKLENKKEEIESIISQNVEWINDEETKYSEIKLTSNINVSDSGDNWEEAYKWLAEKIILFRKTFKKYLK